MRSGEYKPGRHNERPAVLPAPAGKPDADSPSVGSATDEMPTFGRAEHRPGRHNERPPVGPSVDSPAWRPPAPRVATEEEQAAASAAARVADRRSGRRNDPPIAPPPPTHSVSPEELAAAVTALAMGARKAGVRRRLFVPNNAALYNGAFSGFVSGCNQARTIGSTTTGLVAQAVLFAQAVDTLIPTDGTLNQSKVDLLTSLVSNVFGDLYPQGLTEAEYAPVAEQVVALYSEAIALLAAIAPVTSGPFEQPGGVGTVIEPYDETAPFEVSGGSATGTTSVSLGDTSQSEDPNDLSAGGGVAGTGTGAGSNVALGRAVAGSATGNDFAVGPNTADGGYSASVGGASNSADATYSATLGGQGNLAEAERSVCLGGSNNETNADSSAAIGTSVVTYAGAHEGALVFGIGEGFGDLFGANAVGYTVFGATAGGASVLLTNGITGDSFAVPVPVSTVAVRIEVKAIAGDGTDNAEWTYRVLVTCDSAGITTLVGDTTGGAYAPEIHSAGAALWTLAASVTGADNFVNFTFTASVPGDYSCLAQLDTNIG